MTTPSFDVRTAVLNDILDLRYEILRKGQPRESATFELDGNPQTIHAAAWADGQVIGCATFVPNPLDGERAWQLRGMAVSPDWQKAGVGRALLRFLEGRVAHGPTKLLWCNARTPAVPFYKRLGWYTVSDEFIIETAGPHFRMRRDL